MAENFDPYRKWLGIPPEEQPPHHYRLLGIALYEDDLDVITHAADRQMSHVRKFQSGQHGQHSQHVLNELAKARVCLLDRSQKIGYDQELHRTLGGPKRPSAAPVAARRPSSGAPTPSRVQAVAVQPVPPPPTMVATMEPPVPVAVAAAPLATPVASVSSGRPVRAATARLRRRSSPLPLVMAICGFAALAALAAIVAVVASGDIDEEGEADIAAQTSPPTFPTPLEEDDAASQRPAKPPRERPGRPPRQRPPRNTNSDDDPAQPDTLIIPDNPDNRVDEDAPSLPTITREPSDDPPEVDDPPQESPPTNEEPDETSTDALEEEPTDEEPSDEPTEPAVDPAVANDPQRAAKFAAAVSATEDAFAQRDLKEAARQIATARRLMQGEDEESQAAALGELMSHLGTFWRLASTGARKLPSGDELEYGGQRATFDSFSDGDVALIVGGSRLSRPLEDVELAFLVALAARGTPKADSKSRLAIAAFLALDGNASEPERVEEAKSALAEAVNLGGRSPALEQRLAESPAP